MQARDAWRGPDGGIPRNGGDDDDADGDDDDARTEAERARDQWIERTSRAWSEPWRGAAAGPSPAHAYGSNGDDPARAVNAVEAQRRRWTRESPSRDAALSVRDAAYGEYLDYIQNNWRRSCW
jgi:hypothetical protein